MDQLFKQCVGIDIAKQTFTACISQYYISGELRQSDVAEFENDKTGFNQLVKWSRKLLFAQTPAMFLMEATGVYYEQLAYHLHRLDFQVSVVLPNKSKHYAMSLNIKSKNDAIDAQVLSAMGCFQKLPLWSPPATIYKDLRAMTRFREDLIKQHATLKNHLEALGCSENPLPSIAKTYKKLLKEVEKAIEDNDQQIRKLVESDEKLNEKVGKLETIKGVGFNTIVVILAETQGFKMISSRKQLASYAGLDVIERQSGTSICGKTRISKKGNSHIRNALYFPAMVASRFNKPLKEDYLRIIDKNKQHKKIGITALQRKLLLLMFTLWKNDEVFINT